MLCFFFDKALWNEQWEIRIFVAGGFETLVKSLLYVFP